MRNVVIALLLVSALTACNKPVDVKQNLDGSQTVKVQSEDGTATATTKDGESHYEDDKGNIVDSKVNADGSTSISGTSSDGTDFSSTRGKEIDLTIFALKNYPKMDSSESSPNGSVTKTDKQTVAQVVFTTSDSAKEVLAYFAPMITSDKSENVTPGGSFLGGKTSNGSDVAVIASSNGGKTQVSVTASTKK